MLSLWAVGSSSAEKSELGGWRDKGACGVVGIDVNGLKGGWLRKSRGEVRVSKWKRCRR